MSQLRIRDRVHVDRIERCADDVRIVLQFAVDEDRCVRSAMEELATLLLDVDRRDVQDEPEGRGGLSDLVFDREVFDREGIGWHLGDHHAARASTRRTLDCAARRVWASAWR